MEERLNELEMRAMLQERTIQDLNEIVCRQELAMERLEREVHQLREQVKLILPSLTVKPEEDDLPPHY